jgi:hypothetical protein
MLIALQEVGSRSDSCRLRFARDFDLAASFENDSSVKAIARAFQRACQHNGVSVVRRQ